MKRKLIGALSALFMIAGLMLLAVDPIQTLLVKNMSQQAQAKAYTPVNDIVKVNNEVKEVEPVYNFEEVQSLSIWDVLVAQASVKDIPVIGSIHIPNVELTLPIMTGVGKSALAVGAGTMKKDQAMGEGNYSLASHYFEGKDILFGPLYDLKTGDSIYLTDKSYMYEYTTTEVKVIEATDVYIIEDIPEETILTLITCAENGTKRLAVRAEFISRTAIEQQPTA